MKEFARNTSENFINTLVKVSDQLIINYVTDIDDSLTTYVGSIKRRENDWFSTELAAVVHTGEFDAQKIADGMSALLVQHELFDAGDKFELV